MISLEKLEKIQQRFQFLEAKMTEGVSGEEIAILAKEYSELKPVIGQIYEFQTILKQIQDAKEMLKEPDMRDLAEEEIPQLEASLPKI